MRVLFVVLCSLMPVGYASDFHEEEEKVPLHKSSQITVTKEEDVKFYSAEHQVDERHEEEYVDPQDSISRVLKKKYEQRIKEQEKCCCEIM